MLSLIAPVGWVVSTLPIRYKMRDVLYCEGSERVRYMTWQKGHVEVQQDDLISLLQNTFLRFLRL
jgi:hypothetical protein